MDLIRKIILEDSNLRKTYGQNLIELSVKKIPEFYSLVLNEKMLNLN